MEIAEMELEKFFPQKFHRNHRRFLGPLALNATNQNRQYHRIY